MKGSAPVANIARPLILLGGLLASSAIWAASMTVTVRSSDGKPLAGAVLMAYSLDAPNHPAPAVHATMRQLNLAFVPDLLVIPVGSTIDFPNDDSVSHQIYSFSPAKTFQLALYRGKPYPPVRFDKPGLITIGCNIHDTMLAYIVVTDARSSGLTNTEGVWSASDLPRGKYRIDVWHPRARSAPAELQRELTIGEPDHAELTVQLSKPLLPAPLPGHPHSWNTY